jgi:hypothetical protein
MRVVHHDLPDLIEVQTAVKLAEWSGVARAYASPNALHEQTVALETWCSRPEGEIALELGADTGIGGTILRFYVVDMAGHVACHVRLAAGGLSSGGRPEQVSRLAIEIATEPGLIERFARELRIVISSLKGEAVLLAVPA